MAHIHERRLPSPTPSDITELPPRTASTEGSECPLDPLSYAHFSALVQESHAGISLNNLLVIKRSDWEALQHDRPVSVRPSRHSLNEPPDDDDDGKIRKEIEDRVSKARLNIENTYQQLLESYKVGIEGRYAEDFKRMRGKIGDLELQAAGFKKVLLRKESGPVEAHQSGTNNLMKGKQAGPNRATNGQPRGGNESSKTPFSDKLEVELARAESTIRDLQTQLECLKKILASRTTDRVDTIVNDSSKQPPNGHDPKVFDSVSYKAPTRSNTPVSQPPIPIPVGPRAFHSPPNLRPRAKSTSIRQTSGISLTPKSTQIKPTPRVPAGPSITGSSARLTTESLIRETETYKRVVYLTNLGSNFSLPVLLACITQGALENIRPSYARGSCLLFFVRSHHAISFMTAVRSQNSPFGTKYNVNARWADIPISRMDWINANMIVTQRSSRIARFTGVSENTTGHEIEAWWGGLNKFLVGIKIIKVEDQTGRDIWGAEVECMSVRDAGWRVRHVMDNVKKGKMFSVGVEWIEDYCGPVI